MSLFISFVVRRERAYLKCLKRSIIGVLLPCRNEASEEGDGQVVMCDSAVDGQRHRVFDVLPLLLRERQGGGKERESRKQSKTKK